jgi:hypothetical protein
MIAVPPPMERNRGKFGRADYGRGANGHMHEPEPGPNTGDTRCKICGVPLTAVPIDLKRGFGAVAAVVDGVVKSDVMAEPDIERPKNRRERRAELARKRAKR